MKRYNEIDFARAIPLLIMPIVHVFEEFDWWGYLDAGATDFATILMICCVFGPRNFYVYTWHEYSFFITYFTY